MPEVTPEEENVGSHAFPDEQPSDPAPVSDAPAEPEAPAEDPNADVPKYEDGKLPGQEDLPTLPVEGTRRGETPIVAE